jgi:ethanolamine transporter EutH
MNADQHPQAPSSWQGESQGPETATSSRAIKLGLIGSLAGTLAMDLVMVVESLIVGEPVDGFVALIGSVVGGGTLVGVVVHLLMGSLLGLLFGTATYKVRLLNIESVRKGVWLGVLAGLVTIPLGCVPVAIVTGVPIIEMVSFSFVPHLVWGAVLGVIAGAGST